jgi:hypothetical protein
MSSSLSEELTKLIQRTHQLAKTTIAVKTLAANTLASQSEKHKLNNNCKYVIREYPTMNKNKRK